MNTRRFAAPGARRPSKMGNRKAECDGITFDSVREMRRYIDLKLLQRQGEISDLHCGVYFELAPAALLHGDARKKPALRYKADFVYTAKGKQVIEDAKGHVTQEFRTKKHLMKTVLGLDVVEV